MVLVGLGTVQVVGLVGCASGGTRGAAIGGGMGALIGQAAGRDTQSTLIGAAIGTGAGYMIGNEMDRNAAREEQARRNAAQAQRDREHAARIRELEARQAALEADARTPTVGTFVPPSWPSATEQMRPFVDTAWRVTSMTPPPRRAFNSMTLHFLPNGHVITTTELANGSLRTDSETFRVVSNTLIINGSDYLTNSTWTMRGDELTLVNQDFRTTLVRVGDGE